MYISDLDIALSSVGFRHEKGVTVTVPSFEIRDGDGDGDGDGDTP